jgi:hypothetical protein
MELWAIIHAKKIGRPNQVKVKESLFYGKGGGCSK